MTLYAQPAQPKKNRSVTFLVDSRNLSRYRTTSSKILSASQVGKLRLMDLCSSITRVGSRASVIGSVTDNRDAVIVKLGKVYRPNWLIAVENYEVWDYPNSLFSIVLKCRESNWGHWVRGANVLNQFALILIRKGHLGIFRIMVNTKGLN